MGNWEQYNSSKVPLCGESRSEIINANMFACNSGSAYIFLNLRSW
jgi:hypothetical protein